MKQYHTLLEHILEKGVCKQDRTKVGTISIFGYQMRFNLNHSFPLVTTKKCHLKSIIHELLWFLNGDTNIKYLQENGVKIWNEWADESGDLGPVYGKQWRSWPSSKGNNSHDQISNVIKQIKEEPDSRRLVVSAWNVDEIDSMALAPCHVLFQFYVSEGKLSCHLYQRSCDAFLGLPFNIASYSLLTMMIAQQCDLQLGDFIWSGGDVHLYNNHIEQAKIQISRKPLPLPYVELKKAKSIFDYCYSDIELHNYKHHPHLYAPIAV